MPLVKMYGTSDDLFEVFGVSSALDTTDHGQDGDRYPMSSNGSAEFPIYNERTLFVLGDRVSIRPVYDGNWSFGLGIYDPEFNEPGYPDWPTSIRQSEDCHYSVEITIEVPEGYNRIRRIR